MTIGHRVSATSSQIIIFAGRFGSGKTEIALNYAVHLSRQGKTPLLVDLDLVTPYFRTRDKVEEMAQHGVETVTPFDAGHHVDMPAISPRILGAIEQLMRPVVIDLGGDKQGARALAQYATTIRRRPYAMNFVVNPYRPFMDTLAGIRAAIEEIEESTRLQVSALVSNPNLMSESTSELFIRGHCLVEEASQLLDLPIAFVVVADAAHTKTWPMGAAGAPSEAETCPTKTSAPYGTWPTRKVGPSHPHPPVLVIHRFFTMFDVI